MVKGYVKNNSGRSKHIFKRTVYPGQRVPLKEVYDLLGSKVPEGSNFINWLHKYVPKGWEIQVDKTVDETIPEELKAERPYKETLLAVPHVVPSEDEEGNDTANLPDPDDASPSKEYLTPRAIDKLTAKELYELRIKDNPKRILKNVNSIHKLRRALALCKNDNRKSVLTRLIQKRIRELNHTL